MRHTLRKSKHDVGRLCIVATVVAVVFLSGSILLAQPGSRSRTRGSNSTSGTTVSSDTEKGTNPASVLKVNRKTPITYKAFTVDELSDPTTGAKLSSSSTIRFSDGSSMTATEYLEEFNNLEKEFNAIGYSLRGGEETIVLQQPEFSNTELGNQAGSMRSKVISGKNFSPIRTRSYTGEKVGTSKFTLISPSSGSIQSPRDPASGRHRKSSSKGSESTSKSETTPTATVTTTYSTKEKSWDSGLLGKKELFAAQLSADAELVGRSDKYYATVNGDAKLYVVSKSMNVLNISASATSPLREGVDGEISLSVNVLGSNVWSYSDKKDVTWSISDKKGKSFEKGYSFDFTIGPVPVSVTLGAKGSAYLDYELAVMPTKAYGECGITVKASAYGQAGVGIKWASAGVGADFTILSYENNLTGSIEVDLTGEKPEFKNDFSLCHTMTALDGTVYGYLKLGNKQWQSTFVDWSGIKDSGCYW